MEDFYYIDKVLKGEVQTFRHLVNRYKNMAYSIAYGMVKNQPDAEEIVQNAFVKAFKNLASFKKEAKFSSWLYRIVVNQSLNHIKRHKKYRSSGDVDAIQAAQLITLNKASADLERMDKKELIQKVLQVLKAKESLVLQLHYLDEMSIKEIEESTGFSTSNIKVLLHRARKNFYIYWNRFYNKESFLL